MDEGTKMSWKRKWFRRAIFTIITVEVGVFCYHLFKEDSIFDEIPEPPKGNPTKSNELEFDFIKTKERTD